MSTSDRNWCSIFCCKYGKHHPWHASLKYVQLLHGYNGTIHYPFYHILLQDSEGIDWKSNIHTKVTSYPILPILVALVHVWIATNQTTGTTVKKICVVIVKKMCHLTGTSVFLSAPPTFPSVDCMYTNWVCSSHQPTKLGILHCFIK